MIKNKKKSIAIIAASTIFLIFLVFIGTVIVLSYFPSVKEAILMAITVKPETLTELYFEDHQSLPKRVALLKEYDFYFTIHNIENKDMQYVYETYIEENGKIYSLNKNSVFLKNNQHKTIGEKLTVTFPCERAKVVVNLIHENQQINFWVDVE